MSHQVFISYSQDSEEHQKKVLSLADRLRNDGVDCMIDQYEESPAEGWTRWAIHEIEKADFVLVVCTEKYNQLFAGKSETTEGQAANWQGAIITQTIYESQPNNIKFIPIAFSNQELTTHTPIILRAVTGYVIDTKQGYENLYRRLTNQFAVPIPALGAIKQLPRLERQQFFLDQDSQNVLKEEFMNASKGLLNWKRTLGNSQQITRPELTQLINQIETEAFSTTIVLGSPGSGKSSLMASLGHWAVGEKYSLLAIKADYLSNTINGIKDLQDDISLSRHPKDAIKAIANTEKIILLIDQLDAVSELLDRQPGRLNVLLSLIQSLADTKNVHIVATCREFEFRHGTQFARLDSFEPLNLQLPTWEQISPILETEEHDPNRMGEPLRELLKNPLHLKIFLEVAKPCEVFESFPKLLDRLWEVRINSESEPKQLIAFLTNLAERMTEQEDLWLSSSIRDENPESCRTLERAGILMTNQENNLRLGFCHPSLYDHTLARSFACGSTSLADFVLERQDGLFVRPILLRSLNYLRGTAPQQYQHQLEFLLNTAQQQVRSHIHALLIEFLGAQSDPTKAELRLVITLLNSETEGIKVLNAMIGSQGWFRKLRDRGEFTQWLEKPVEQAAYCSPLLTVATNFAPEDVWYLLEEYWLDDSSYDLLSIRVIWNIGQWTPERVWLVQQVIQRSNIDWDSVAGIAEKIAETLPNCAIKVIRAHLDYLRAEAMEAAKKPVPELPANANEAERSFHAYRYNPLNPLKDLLESESHFYEIEKFAEAYPQSFLDSIWSWFVEIIQRLAYEASPAITIYRGDKISNFKFSRSEIIQALLAAIIQLAKQDKSAFIRFFEENMHLDLLTVQRLLARGLEVISTEEPITVLNYLLADSRRLSLGGQMGGDRHEETEKLIAAIVPHLQPEDRERLEQSIQEFKYWLPSSDTDVHFRRRCVEYNREHRLSLLQAIPDEYISLQVKRLKEEEERAFPWVELRKNNSIITGGLIGPRMTKDEMARAKDQHLLKLFDELSDETRWDHPRRQWVDDFSRAGGAIQQSREFAELVKDDPSRFIRILPQLEPQRHESYVGKALEELAGTDYPINNLLHFVEQAAQRGLVSEHFRSDVARALEKIAKRNHGLPRSSLFLLEGWLPDHSQPEPEHDRSRENQSSDLKSPIVFGVGSSHALPGGRGNIVRAIAEGYLEQNPPNLEGWAEFIRSQLRIESHPAVWVDILVRMPPLLNGNRVQATELFDQVIRNCPEVLQYPWALYFIARTIGWFDPKETVQGWLEILRAENSNFSQQAYGELLLIQYLQYQDEWSVERIREHLATNENEAILCGLAHAASHLWGQRRCRAIATEILQTLTSSSHESVQQSVASIFRWSRDPFTLNQSMLKLIQAVSQNQGVLLKAANDLAEIIEAEELAETHPDIVTKICESLVNTGAELSNPARPTPLIADSLTTIAIKLHRQSQYREAGLNIFEQLLALNLRETKSALETLDRQPNRPSSYRPPRKRLRRRRPRNP